MNRKVEAGQPLSIQASAWNSLLDLLQQIDPSQLRRGLSGSTSLVKVRNAAGVDLDQYAIVALGDPVFDWSDNLEEFKQNWAVDCVAPDYPTEGETIAILREPLASGAIGLATSVGLTPARVYVDDESDRWALYEAGATDTLTSCPTIVPGAVARIIAKEAGTGTRWALVDLNGFAGLAAQPLRVTDVKTGTYTAAAGELVLYDVTAGGFTHYFPAGPTLGNEVAFYDYGGHAGNFLSLDGNGNNVQGGSLSLGFANNYKSGKHFRFVGGSVGWACSAGPLT